MGEKWDRKKKVKFLITLSACFSLLAITVLLVIWSILLTDKTRGTYVRSETEYSEIINKNYIKGFESISESGEFSFRFREDEINDLLMDGVKTINDKHIEKIYYEKGNNNFYIFYVDLKKIPVKTRVVLTTYVGDWDDNSVTLKIYTAKIGKVEASKYLVRKGYLTEKFLNKYFESCHLPISYNEQSKAFVIKATDYISMFPKGNFANLLWNEVLASPTSYKINPTTLGINVSFSKLRTESELTKKTFENALPNFYQELKDELEAVDFSTMSVGESKTAYSISLDEFDHLLMNNMPVTKEEVESNLLSSKATFELVGTSTTLKAGDKLDIAYLYSLNGYLLDIHQEVEFYDYSTNYFEATFEIKKPITFNSKSHSESNDEYQKYFNSIFKGIFENIQENPSNLLGFNESNNSLVIDLETMNDSHSSSTLRNAWKSIVLDSTNKAINFSVQKTV